MDKKYIFDICWTLYKANTTFDFICFFSQSKSKKLYLGILDNKVVKILLILIGKMVGMDIYRALYIFSLKGSTKSQLEDAAREYVEYILSEKKIAFSHDFLNQSLRDKGGTILLCSASLDCIVKAVALNLGVSSFYASELEYINGICTGKLRKDLLHTKVDLFKNEHKPFWVITDNKTDLDLIRQSENHTILSNKKNMKFWNENGLSVGFIMED
ncbi:hypothetical protein X781_19960 [Mannheimia sp. USDA-ARS-USMARC-1261]|uniref:haloacid dehalogenase-like hydrolase n=1 Tax=Mannheimia sp. USDA-ARS-USMARC-1261 TaxID=1432056 RepID=UPI0003E3237E|nr:haloacid dehalogenase-like hydrolase [Mannheimia sp. USDA-ARS-USMARC-1261]AHG74141.1 hypothetical protein X781_19960 [Mannheimia sp. USDA-ARS-USMARC-1261]